MAFCKRSLTFTYPNKHVEVKDWCLTSDICQYVIVLTPFSGLHIQTCRLLWWGLPNRISSLHSNMSACGAWWRWRLHAILFRCGCWASPRDYAICKFENLYIRIIRCNNDATAMITIFCTVVLSVIQGIALNTDVLPLSKGRALQNGIRA